MDGEIREAVAAFMAARQCQARERLLRDGAESTAAMQRRVQAIAAERSIPPADYAKLLYKRVSTAAICTFCLKHTISVDWLFFGDLKGLQRMTRKRREQNEAVAKTLAAEEPEPA